MDTSLALNKEGSSIYNPLSVERKRKARHADLYDFLIRVHPQDVIREGKFLRLKSQPSVVLKKGFCGFNDYYNNTTGNSVDLLTGYLGYSFCEAVDALSGREISPVTPAPAMMLSDEAGSREISLPKAATPPYTRVFAYLTKTRGIPAETVRRLMEKGLLYQEEAHGNAIFVNRERDYCEVRGTLSYGKPFHGCLKARSDNYWSFGHQARDRPVAYICEAAIDAVSLYEILRAQGPVNAIFCSIGGVANQKTIDRIAGQYSAILAVDNDEAGAKCRERNPDLPFILPAGKDWNQDLISHSY